MMKRGLKSPLSWLRCPTFAAGQKKQRKQRKQKKQKKQK